MGKKISKDILICPHCKSDSLVFQERIILCGNCRNEYRIQNSKFLFTRVDEDNVQDSLDKVKYFFKRFDRLYNFLIYLVSPVCSHGHTYKFLKEHIEDKDIIALNLGSGNSNISSNVTNIDIFAYPNVDVACNIENLPFKDGSVDVILSIAVLEHLASPEKVVSEMNRVLKANGIVYCFFPFIQGFHASPHDYSRRTLEGMKVLFIDFEQIDLKPSGGPTSGLLWVLQEWLAMIFSLGIKPLYHIFLFLSMVLTFPLKFLDLFLIKHPVAGNISSGFVYIGRKREMVDSRTSR